MGRDLGYCRVEDVGCILLQKWVDREACGEGRKEESEKGEFGRHSGQCSDCPLLDQSVLGRLL